MELKENQIFNLWNTNGRRSDVLNALWIYLDILKKGMEEHPDESWKSYPDSLAQYRFYQEAIEASPEVFQEHKKYDEVIKILEQNLPLFLEKNEQWVGENYKGDLKKIFDEAIEARARHYTSNLVKLGFANENRNITSVGYSFWSSSIEQDAIEKILPIDSTNMILLRQLLKIKVFTRADKIGRRKFYSPFKLALYLLLGEHSIDIYNFVKIIQGVTPYLDKSKIEVILQDGINYSEINLYDGIKYSIPLNFNQNKLIKKEDFENCIKNRKSGKTPKTYYEFYKILFEFRKKKSEKQFNQLVNLLKNNDSILRKAFGEGKAIFELHQNSASDKDTFLKENVSNLFLTTKQFNRFFYEAYIKSKYLDAVQEYSDTTLRMISATGLFKLGNTLPELAYKEALEIIFDRNELKKDIFGVMNEKQYQKYNELFNENASLCNILGYTQTKKKGILKNLLLKLDVMSAEDAKDKLKSKKSEEFKEFIHKMYPKENVMELLNMFSDRSNDGEIKKRVNDSATVPTIYEYIVAIAWYYVADKNFDIYNSLNLTLNADFQPIIHAGGGKGDIVIEYPEQVVMLEVTLMNKNAQKRGEWEPVLRHSVNLKAENTSKESITFFIADELDLNTINIWRAVAAVPLKATNSKEVVDSLMIMPLQNSELIMFLKEGIKSDVVIKNTKDSFSSISKDFDDSWRTTIIDSVLNG